MHSSAVAVKDLYSTVMVTTISGRVLWQSTCTRCSAPGSPDLAESTSQGQATHSAMNAAKHLTTTNERV
jgi:hypothetical protein